MASLCRDQLFMRSLSCCRRAGSDILVQASAVVWALLGVPRAPEIHLQCLCGLQVSLVALLCRNLVFYVFPHQCMARRCSGSAVVTVHGLAVFRPGSGRGCGSQGNGKARRGISQKQVGDALPLSSSSTYHSYFCIDCFTQRGCCWGQRH